MWLELSIIIYCVVMSSWASSHDKITNSLTKPRTRSLNYNLVCPAGCVTCSPLSGCVSCMTGLYMLLIREGIRQTGVCVKSCPAGYYGLQHSNNYNRCYKCNLDECDHCVSSTYCITCKAPHIAYKGQCVSNCPTGLFYESYSRSCLPKVDCSVGEWNDWDTCKKDGQVCGYKYGIQQRKRSPLKSPTPNGLACPALTEYRTCRLTYRFCSDLENNNSDLVTIYYNNRLNRHDNTRNRIRMYRKKKRRKEKRRRRRNRCKARGRVWSHGVCLRKHRQETSEKLVSDISQNEVDYTIINRGKKMSHSYKFGSWVNSLENRVKL